MAYENKHVLRDGRIILYTGNGGSVYYTRISVDGLAGYVTQSTRIRSLDRACEVAEDLYDDLRYKVRNNEEIGLIAFKNI